jgi:hypothetical protein
MLNFLAEKRVCEYLATAKNSAESWMLSALYKVILPFLKQRERLASLRPIPMATCWAHAKLKGLTTDLRICQDQVADHGITTNTKSRNSIGQPTTILRAYMYAN